LALTGALPSLPIILPLDTTKLSVNVSEQPEVPTLDIDQAPSKFPPPPAPSLRLRDAV
jgi:hypothetical protein